MNSHTQYENPASATGSINETDDQKSEDTCTLRIHLTPAHVLYRAHGGLAELMAMDLVASTFGLLISWKARPWRSSPWSARRSGLALDYGLHELVDVAPLAVQRGDQLGVEKELRLQILQVGHLGPGGP